MAAQYALIGGNREEALKLFRTAAKDCPRGFLEGIAAGGRAQGDGREVGVELADTRK